MNDYEIPAQFDPLIHQPSRLSIMAILVGCEQADYTYLANTANLTMGTLSKHLTRLQNAGYVKIEKRFKGNYPNTTAALTAQGRRAFKDYRKKYIAFSKAMGDDK